MPDKAAQRAEALRWLAHGDLDLRSIRALLGSSPALVDPAAFHCQQAVEKMAKALLVFLGREPPHIHDIARLGRLVSRDLPDIARVIDDLAELTAWYIAGRYPILPEPGPSIDDVQKALKNLIDLRRQISAIVSEDESH